MLASQELEKRRAAVDHLAGLEMRIAAPYLLERLRDSEPGVRARAARALGPGAVLEAAPPLLSCMNDVEAPVRAACVESFGQFGALPTELQKRAAITLARVMADGQYDVRLEVLRAVERPSMQQVDGLWVHQGTSTASADWAAVIDNVRDERADSAWAP
jgi:hypothetical protein